MLYINNNYTAATATVNVITATSGTSLECRSEAIPVAACYVTCE